MLGVLEKKGGQSGGKRMSKKKVSGYETRGHVGGSGSHRAL